MKKLKLFSIFLFLVNVSLSAFATAIDDIDAQIKLEHYQEALDITNKALESDPDNAELVSRKTKLQYLLKEYKEAAFSARKAIELNPQDLTSVNILNDISESLPEYAISPNVLGAYQSSLYATSPDDYWNYTTLFYSREMDFGRLVGYLNYQSRLEHSSMQGIVEAVVNLDKNFYVDLNVGYADNLFIFPKYNLGGEAYWNIPDMIQLSAGDLYRNISPTYFNTYTVSATKYIGDHTITFRPLYFVPKEGQTSILWTISGRYYYDSLDNWVGVGGGAGKTPDLADLETIDFIVLNDWFANITYEFPLDNHHVVIDMGMSYEHQIFPSGKIRQLTGLNVGLKGAF